MSILLQSKDKYNDVIELDPSDGVQVLLNRDDHPELDEKMVGGSYATIGEHRIMFYRVEGELVLEIDGKNKVNLGDKVMSSLKRHNGTATLVLEDMGGELLRYDYSLEDIDLPIPGDMTPFIEDEDFDFPLFVHNVLSDPERREIIYK